MSELVERRITEWAEFYHKNKDRIPPANLQKRCEFAELMLDGLVEIVAVMAKDIQRLEGRDGGAIRLPNGGLLLPVGFKRHDLARS